MDLLDRGVTEAGRVGHGILQRQEFAGGLLRCVESRAVTDHRHGALTGAGDDGAEAHIHRKVGPVSVTSPDLHAPPHRANSWVGFIEVAMTNMRRAETPGHQLLHPPADESVAGVAEQILDSAVGQNDRSALIDHEDAVGSQLHDHPPEPVAQRFRPRERPSEIDDLVLDAVDVTDFITLPLHRSDDTSCRRRREGSSRGLSAELVIVSRAHRMPRSNYPLTAALVAGAVVIALVVAVWPRPTRPVLSPSCTVTAVGGSFTVDLEQAANAATIAVAAKRLGLTNHAVTVGLAAALQESGLHNLDYGDRDSLGLFQQRPSQGWGVPTEIMNPPYAANAFFRHLASIPNWSALTVAEAAQRVQRSAAPDAYAQWEPKARILASALTGEVAEGLGCQFPLSATGPGPPLLETAMLSEWHRNPLGVVVDDATGWTEASWLVAHASKFHIRQVTFAGRRWTPASPAWSRVGSVLHRVDILT